MILGKWGIYPLLTGLMNLQGSFTIWVIGALLYLFTFATGNVQHDYYQIPIIPIVSILLAVGVSKLWASLSGKLIAVICIGFMLFFSWYDIRGNYQVNHWEIVEAGQAVDKMTPKDAIVVAPYQGDTAFLYQTNRRGFPFMYMPIKDFIDRFNATYYVSVNYDDDTNKIMEKYTVIEKNPKFVIVKLIEPIRPL